MKMANLGSDSSSDDELSYHLLMNHIRQNHPKINNEEVWNISSDIKSLISFSNDREIPKILKDIGLGASLYLLTLKTFAYLFLILTFLNIPIFIIFLSGNESKDSPDGI